ncbi:MAG: glutamate racemase [Methylobacteriaceae bacterium]|nr:glutamate racemase [Methylobacteriaceae bacterium]
MRADLLAGTSSHPIGALVRQPTILLFDSGLGGLSVLAELRKVRPDARIVYAADDAAFPYGRLAEDVLLARVGTVIDRLVERVRPDIVVIACNTASTVAGVLTGVRARCPVPIVGTVPPIKPAAALSRSGRFSVLATPGTIARGYTRDLIEAYAGACRVTLVGSSRLAALAEATLAGEPVTDEELAIELAPCFVADETGRTDLVVLGCTHYPLLLPRLEALAPWSVTWLDPAGAVARRAGDLLGPRRGGAAEPESFALFTGGAGLTPGLRAALAERGLADVVVDPLGLGQA